MTRPAFAFLIFLLTASAAQAVEHVVVRQKGEEVSVSGRLLVTAEDGGMLLEAADGSLWTAPPEDLVRHKHDDEPLRPLSPQEMAERLRGELPGFEVYTTQHYVICHNTSRAYAQWCGALFERLFKAFTNFWSRKDFELHEPEFPLVALVFADGDSYAAYAGKELGDNAGAIIGYYSFASNRIMMHDLTGIQALRNRSSKRSTPNEINQMLARPEAERTVATIIHEATHQIALNCGLQQRYADIPLWYSEGMAIYFEAPDLSNSKGWRTIGAVNQVRLARFRQYLQKGRPADSLSTLILNHERLRDPKRADDAYAEAWALNYFLLRQRPKQYMTYTRLMAEKQPLVQDDAATRLREFQQAFGDLDELDADFVKQMAKVR
ncbi:MAG TPA: DUF1570 domain-containing protein [Pirellulales bacterium]|nr:DUF1570 domain-containing protein [Pirellulales bacterium]